MRCVPSCAVRWACAALRSLTSGSASVFTTTDQQKAMLRAVTGMAKYKELIKTAGAEQNVPGSTTSLLNYKKQLKDSISTEGNHGSITFSANAKYTYTAASTTTRAMTLLIEQSDTS